MSGTNLETIVNFSKRKGFVFQSSEIYGGFAATYDYGPLGFLLKNNLVKAWRDWNVNTRTDTVEIEGAIFLHPKVWQASGHIAGFADLMVEDLKTHKRYRADHLVEDAGVVWPVGENNEKLKIENSFLTKNQIDEIEKEITDKGFELAIDCFISNERGEVFAQRRSQNRRLYPGGWDLPGGHVDSGDTVYKTIFKEVKEELNLEVDKVIKLIDRVTWTVPTDKLRDGENPNKVILQFEVTVKTLEGLKLEEGKADKYEWINLKNVETLKTNENLYTYNSVKNFLTRTLTILFATTNIGKITRFKRLLRDQNFNILTLSDLDYKIEEPEETGNDVVENAEIKARYYWENLKLKMPVVCEDQGTYFIGVDEVDNPRKDIKKPVIEKYGNSSQENMISYYSDLANKYGGALDEVWEYGFAFYDGVDVFKTKAIADNAKLVSTPKYPGVEGFPFSSLCQHKIGDTWKYASDVTENEMEQCFDQPIKEKIFELLGLVKTTAVGNDSQSKENLEYQNGDAEVAATKGNLITNAGSFTATEIDQIIEFYNIKSPDGNPVSKAKSFNLLVKTHLGPVEDETTVAYLKGESCQNIYVDWKLVQETTRRKLPFGIAQLGKAFRNEVTVKQFMFRTREFEQIDLQYFVKPGQEDEWYNYWKQNHYQFYTQKLKFKPENLQWHQHSQEELVFYCKEAWDINYKYGALGYKEMEGVHNRTDYDTKVHQEYSGQDLTYLDPFTNERFLPYIVEMSAGVNRMFLALLFEFYTEEEVGEGDKQETRVVFKLPYDLAPYKLAILPLMKKDGLAEIATELYSKFRSSGLSVDYDESGSIGKRYRRQDENGTPFCVTIDYDTHDKGLVTIRNRDTMAQETIKIEEIEGYLNSNKN